MNTGFNTTHSTNPFQKSFYNPVKKFRTDVCSFIYIVSVYRSLTYFDLGPELQNILDPCRLQNPAV